MSMSREQKVEQATREWLAYKETHQRETWEERADVDEQFYYSVQWTDKERKEMMKRQLWPAVQNEILNPARQIISELSTQAPSFKVMTPNGANTDAQWVISGLIRHVEHNSNRGVQISRVARQVVTSGGIGYLVLEVDSLAADGQPELYSRWISNRYVFVPTTCTDIPSLKDASSVIIAKPEPLAVALRQYPKKKEQLESASDMSIWMEKYSGMAAESGNDVDVGLTDDSPWASEFGANSVVKLQRYSLERRKRWRVTNHRTGESFITYDSNVTLIDQVSQVLGFVSREPLADVIRCKILFGYAPDIWLDEVWLELDCYPITAFVVEDTGNTFPVDLTWFVKDQQILLNKFRSAEIQYLQQAGAGKIIISKDADEADKKEIRDKWSSVNAVLELEYGPDGQAMFQVVQPSPIPPTLLANTAQGAANIQRGYGVFSLTMGDPAGAHRTNKGLVSLRQFNMESRRTMLDMWNAAYQDHYEKMVKMLPFVYSASRAINYIDDDFVPVTLQMNKEEWVGGAYRKFTQVVRDDGIFQIDGDLGAIDAMIVLSPDSFLPTDRAAMMQLFAEMNQAIGGHPALVKQMIRFTDLPNRADILAEIDMLPKLQAQNERLNEFVQALVAQLEDSQRKQVELEFDAIKQEFRAKEGIQFQKDKAESKIQREEDRLARKEQMLEQEYEFKKNMLALDMLQRRFKMNKLPTTTRELTDG